jgi:hypothetical protein
MSEQLKQYYVKEEEFLDRFESVALIAARSLDGVWSPDFHCDDAVRRSRDVLLSTHQLDQLVFVGAAVYHTDAAFSSAQIALRSATRVVNVRVRKIGSDLVAEKLADRAAVGGAKA